MQQASWIDLHAHLDRLNRQELAAAIEDATRAGVGTIVSTATDLAAAAQVAEHCRSFPSLYGAVGISPFDVAGLHAGWEDELRLLAGGPRIIAIGEIGLDQSNPRYPSMAEQLPVFEKQLEMAVALDLPVIIHSRGAESRVADICRNAGTAKVVFHCFTGDPETLRKIIGYGYYVSFSGIVTFSKSVEELATQIPLEHLFIETDTPYLAPVPHRGKQNRPAWVALTGEKVAEYKGIAKEVLQEAISANFRRLFGPRL